MQKAHYPPPVSLASIETVHFIVTMQQLDGCGDLGEDTSERARQNIIRNDAQLKGLQSLDPRARVEAEWDTLRRQPLVKQRITEVVVDRQRNFKSPNRENAKSRAADHKIDRNNNRDALLEMPLPQGEYRYTTLRESKKKEDGAPCDDNVDVVFVVVADECVQ